MRMPRTPPEPRVIGGTTLVCADCSHPALALRALALSRAQCRYERTILFTDGTPAAVDQGIERVAIPRFHGGADYSRFMLKELVRFVETPFVQVIQWDGYVTNAAAWSDDFFAFDYIGAKWWSRPEGSNVGNGGFSLRSRKLLLALADPDIEASHPEDDAICLRHAALLAARHGIRIAPSVLADRYAFEGEDPTGAEFGFHRMFNLPYFNGEGELRGIISELGDDDFCNPGAVTLVEILARRGRLREALRYARRLRSCVGFGSLPPAFRANLMHVVLGLLPQKAACACGSGRASRSCCGSHALWQGA